MECYLRGWPVPELKAEWDTDRKAFVAQVLKYHDRIALDWGFPVFCLSWVEELRTQGVRLIWFDGDIASARREFVKRGGIEVMNFDAQVTAIQNAGYPSSLNCVVVPALSGSGGFLNPREIEKAVFLTREINRGDRSQHSK